MASLTGERDVATRIGFWLLAAAAIGVGVLSFRYVTLSPEVAPEGLRPSFARNTFDFVIHTVAGGTAILIGLWQFLPGVRRRTRLHRTLGRIYVPACLVSAIAGFSIAWSSWAGTWASLGFASMAVVWFAVTSAGWVMARRRDFAAHPHWMARSYAVTCAAISFRILINVLPVTGLPFKSGYALSSFLCWMVNLAIAEWLIRRGKIS